MQPPYSYCGTGGKFWRSATMVFFIDLDAAVVENAATAIPAVVAAVAATNTSAMRTESSLGAGKGTIGGARASGKGQGGVEGT